MNKKSSTTAKCLLVPLIIGMIAPFWFTVDHVHYFVAAIETKPGGHDMIRPMELRSRRQLDEGEGKGEGEGGDVLRIISYGVLLRNFRPCNITGAPYYNCTEGAQANPYRRECTAISRCRRDNYVAD